MEEKRIDCSKASSAEQSALDLRLSKLVWEFNNTFPYDPKAQELVRKIFEGRIGAATRISAPLLGVRFGSVRLGHHVIIGQNCLMMSAGGITIDDKAMLAANCQLLSNNHDMYERMVITCKPIHICEGAWLGAGVSVMAGVTIGRYAVVGAASVVTKDIPDYAVAVGNPARVIRYLDPEKEQKWPDGWEA